MSRYLSNCFFNQISEFQIKFPRIKKDQNGKNIDNRGTLHEGCHHSIHLPYRV
jgi:hypothetical protein